MLLVGELGEENVLNHYSFKNSILGLPEFMLSVIFGTYISSKKSLDKPEEKDMM